MTTRRMPVLHRFARRISTRGLRGSQVIAAAAERVTPLIDTVVTELDSGGAIVADGTDWIARNAYFGLYERPELAILRALVRPGDTVIDVGANVGYWTTHAARWVAPDGLVVAIEPSPRCLRSLRGAVTAMPSKTIVFPVAAGAHDGTGILVGSDNPVNSGLGTLTVDEGLGVGGSPVDVRRLASMLDECRVRQCALVKIDVEGRDHEVLAGLAPHLAAGEVDSLIVEVGGSMGNPPEVVRWVQTSSRQMTAYEITERGRFVRRPALIPITSSAVGQLRRQANILFLTDARHRAVASYVCADV